MHVRPVYFLPVATVFLLASPNAPAASLQRAYTLRIESFNRSPLKVRITTADIAPERRGGLPRDTVRAPPTRLPSTGKVGRRHAKVDGYAPTRGPLTYQGVDVASIA